MRQSSTLSQPVPRWETFAVVAMGALNVAIAGPVWTGIVWGAYFLAKWTAAFFVSSELDRVAMAMLAVLTLAMCIGWVATTLACGIHLMGRD